MLDAFFNWLRIRGRRGAAVAALAVTCTAATGIMSASAETRTLKLYNTHTHERVQVTFKKNGRYISSGLRELNRALRDWRRNEVTQMDPKLFDLVWEVYQRSGSNDYIHVVSGYRSPATNNMLRGRSRGVAKNSQHMRGKAMDFYIPGVNLANLRAIGLRKEVGGVGYYPTSGSPFIHLDTGSVRHWPRMTRSQLAKVFPDGKTIHIPSDGKPMPGYAEALARHKSGRGSDTVVASSSSGSRTTGQVLTRGDDGAPVRPAGTSSGRNFLTALFSPNEREDKSSDAEAARSQASNDASVRVAAVKPDETSSALPGVAAAERERATPDTTPSTAIITPPLPEKKAAPETSADETPVVAATPKAKPERAAATIAVAAAESGTLGAQAQRLSAGLPAVEPVTPAPATKERFDRIEQLTALPEQKPEAVLAAAPPVSIRKPIPADGMAAIAAATGTDLRQGSGQDDLASAVLAYAASHGTPDEAPNPLPARPRSAAPDAKETAVLPSVSGAVPQSAVDDPFARFAALPDRSEPKLISGIVTTRTAAFATLSHPNQRALSDYFVVGSRILPTRFDQTPSALRSDRFEGPAVVLLPVVSLR